MLKPYSVFEVRKYKEEKGYRNYVYIYEPIFRRSLYVVKEIFTKKQYAGWLKEIECTNQELNIDGRIARAFQFDIENQYGSCITFFNKNISAGVIAHEVAHIVYEDMRRMGVELCQESEEVFTYLQTFYIDIIESFCKDKNL